MSKQQDIEALIDLFELWTQKRKWAEQLICDTLNLQQAHDIFGPPRVESGPFTADWRIRLHGVGVELSKEGNVGGIDFDFDKYVPCQFRMRDFMVKQYNGGALRKKTYRPLMQDQQRFEQVYQLAWDSLVFVKFEQLCQLYSPTPKRPVNTQTIEAALHCGGRTFSGIIELILGYPDFLQSLHERYALHGKSIEKHLKNNANQQIEMLTETSSSGTISYTYNPTNNHVYQWGDGESVRRNATLSELITHQGLNDIQQHGHRLRQRLVWQHFKQHPEQWEVIGTYRSASEIWEVITTYHHKQAATILWSQTYRATRAISMRRSQAVAVFGEAVLQNT